jgi:hypothetical protein
MTSRHATSVYQAGKIFRGIAILTSPRPSTAAQLAKILAELTAPMLH